MSTQTFDGGCLCGSTRFHVTGAAINRCYCHCRSCRLASGAPYIAWVTFPTNTFQLIRGEIRYYQSSEKVLRGFCSSCGSTITYQHQDRPEELDITITTLDETTTFAPECHIWVSHKLSWVIIGDQLPQHLEWRNAGD